MPADPKSRRAARHAPPAASAVHHGIRNEPITVDRITDAALEIIATGGYDSLTMRSVAARLNTGPASLYAHVVNKADIDELIIGRICSRLVLPTPERERWREQITDVCVQLRDQYLKYPGISRAALAMDVTNLDVLTVAEGMLAILIVGGIEPQTAAWAFDALFLYVGAYTLEASVVSQRQGSEEWMVGRDNRAELVSRFAALPADRFPQTRRYAEELTSGTGHQRFDFALGLILDSLADRRAKA
jgi:AcrR family transcriptional regulator